MMNNHKTKPIIELKNISKVYSSLAGDFTAVNNISLDFHKGAFVSIVGKSGSGKSTFLNLLTGIDRATSGEIHVNGTDVNKFKEKNISVWRGENIGIIFQFFQLMPTLTAVENIMLPMDLVGVISKKTRKEKALQLLEKVGLNRHADKFPSELSGGEQQRVAIARAMANKPPVIVADEPTGNLDVENSRNIISLFEKLNKEEGKTIIMVTHEREKIIPASRTIELSDGKVIKDAFTEEEVKAV